MRKLFYGRFAGISDGKHMNAPKQPRISVTLHLLEHVGAIHRVKKGRTKIITVTPEGAFRGNINNHAKAVEKFKLEVIDGGKKEKPKRKTDGRQTDIEDFL